MKYTIQKLIVGPLSSNAYLVSNSDHQAFLVDAGGDAKKILKEIEKQELELMMILNTHGHYDHIAANAEIMKATGAPLYIHERDLPILFDAERNLSSLFAAKVQRVEEVLPLQDGQKLPFGEEEILVIHTPGHTPGGVCFLYQDQLFTGDTLFSGSVGRSDLVGGNTEQLLQSIRDKIMVLPDETTIWPGHNKESNLARERNSNPWVRQALEI